MTDREVLIQAIEGRQSFYESLKGYYFAPLTQEQVDRLAEIDWASLAGEDEVMVEGFDDIRRYLRKRNTGTRQELAVDYTSSFGGVQTYEGRYAVPYESVFRSEAGLPYQEQTHEVFREYKQSLIKRRDGVDYPDDALTFEFEFMGVLCERTIDALRGKDDERAVELLEQQQRFSREHIASWFDDFAKLALKLIKTRFYRGVLKITGSFIDSEDETIADLIDGVRELAQTEAAAGAGGKAEAIAEAETSDVSDAEMCVDTAAAQDVLEPLAEVV